MLTEFFKTRGAQSYNFTAAPGQDINTRLQNMASSGACKPKPSVRIKRNLNRPLDNQSRRTQLTTPQKEVVFGQNRFSSIQTKNPFRFKPQSPSDFGFSPDPTGATNQPSKTEFEHNLIQAFRSKSVVNSMTALIDKECSTVMENIQKQLILLNSRLDKNEGEITPSELTIPDPRGV